jgi:hypothetical protein
MTMKSAKRAEKERREALLSEQERVLVRTNRDGSNDPTLYRLRKELRNLRASLQMLPKQRKPPKLQGKDIEEERRLRRQVAVSPFASKWSGLHGVRSVVSGGLPSLGKRR